MYDGILLCQYLTTSVSRCLFLHVLYQLRSSVVCIAAGEWDGLLADVSDCLLPSSG